VTKPNYSSLNQLSDSTFTHTGINTVSDLSSYKLDFYANNVFVGSAQTASSVFLSLSPADRKMTLNWTHSVPWTNVKYRIRRKDPGQSSFALIDSTSSKTYTDSNLVNRATYCYVIEAFGEYSDPGIAKPLINLSQEVCASPKDLTKPCSPNLTIVSDCQTGFVQLTWNNPNHTCADDVVKYNLYFKATEDEPLVLIDSIKNLSDTVYTFDALNSIAGCYVVTAVDSSGNESIQDEAECVDNCPEFELPNVVTMNGDSINDFFKAIRVRYIKEIDLQVFNRWGNLVYQTTDPYFKWDGTVIQTKALCSEGTYFYVCDVYEIRVKGTQKRTLKGFVQVFH
jgi:gliding motility-associated-like protein